MQFVTKLLAAAAPCFLIAGMASATPVLDLNSPPAIGANAASFTGGSNEWQQQVTEDATGTLAGITLYGDGSGELKIAAGNGFNTGPWAIDVTTTISESGTFIDLSSFDFGVKPGSNFVFDLSGFEDYDGSFPGDPSTNLWLDTQGTVLNWTQDEGPWSIGFQTYLDEAPTPIPEPASLAILGFGLAGLGVLRRRQAR